VYLDVRADTARLRDAPEDACAGGFVQRGEDRLALVEGLDEEAG